MMLASPTKTTRRSSARTGLPPYQNRPHLQVAASRLLYNASIEELDEEKSFELHHAGKFSVGQAKDDGNRPDNNNMLIICLLDCVACFCQISHQICDNPVCGACLPQLGLKTTSWKGGCDGSIIGIRRSTIDEEWRVR